MRIVAVTSLTSLAAGALGLLLSMLACSSLAAESLPDFADLVEKNAPSIVEISTTRRVAARNSIADDRIEEFLRRLNPGKQPDLSIEGLPGQRQRGTVGSGFLISKDGYIMTNNHVVAGADEIQVSLNDRRVFDARVIGLDEPSDLALLKIDALDLPHVQFGDSDVLRVGDWVLAIGSPFGLGFSAAAGIVSAKGRSMPARSTYNYMSFIQTDVAINQGNSGGPLFNLDGDVVGINSQILSSPGGSNGISFSIPSNVAMNVMKQLRDTGAVQRGLLGVRMGEVGYALAEIFGMGRPRGAFVQDVQIESPAANAGILVDDIILEFNAHEIEHFTDLPFYVGQYRPGTEATVRIFREGDIRDLIVILGSSPTNSVVVAEPEIARERNNPLGFRIREPSADVRRVTGLNGVQIAELNEGPGREAGLVVGDVIVSLNRQQIESADKFASVASKLPESGFVPIRIVREGQGNTLALELNP